MQTENGQLLLMIGNSGRSRRNVHEASRDNNLRHVASAEDRRPADSGVWTINH